MQVCLVLTVLGPDRPGLVRQLAASISGCGGNWLESRMGRLGGEFAGILRCQVPAERQGELEAALSEWGRGDFAVTVKPDPGQAARTGSGATLELVGQDRPRIVEQITAALARFQVNVEELKTECASAPMSGETLFHAWARVWIPGDCDLPMLQREIERIAADLQVDVTLQAGGAPD